MRLRTVCPHDCPDTCSIVTTVENGRVTACEGDSAHPFTRGFLCHKVTAYDKRIYSKDRILYPLIEGKRATWDEALNLIVARLGSGESVLPYSYGGTLGLVARNAGHPFFHKLGACRLKRTICDDAADAAWRSMVGKTIGTDCERVSESDLIVVWGMNASVVNIHLMPFIRDAQQKGAKLLVIDPYRNETAKMADQHVFVRPGTDAALALSLARVLIEENLVDREYLSKHTEGFDRFAERVRSFTSEVHGVADVRELARQLARAKAPFIRLGIGFSRHANGGQAVRSVLALAAMMGAFRRGGATFETWEAFDFDLDLLRRPDLLPRPTREVNMVQLGDALTADDRIKSLFVYQCNPAAVCPDQSKVLRGLSRPDLFVVVHEQVMTDTCDYADVVLPACTSFETGDLYRSYGHYYLQRAKPVIAPVGESRSNVDLFNELGRRFGFRDEIFTLDADARIDRLLQSRNGAVAGIDLAALNRGEPVRIDVPRGDPFEKGFPTPSGKFMFANDTLPDPLPGYVPCPEGCESEARKTYPLQLLAPPAKHFLNTTFGSVEELVHRQKRPTVMLHPSEAASRGLSDGALVRVFNERGQTQAHLLVTDDILPGVAVIPSIWWSKHTPGGTGVNALTSQRLTDLGESSTFHCALVEVDISVRQFC